LRGWGGGVHAVMLELLTVGVKGDFGGGYNLGVGSRRAGLVASRGERWRSDRAVPEPDARSHMATTCRQLSP
jgi:hypothetical protein